MSVNAYWKGVLFSLVGAVVIPVLTQLQSMLTSNVVNWAALATTAISCFVGFLIMFLTGLIHYPDGTTVHVTPQTDLVGEVK